MRSFNDSNGLTWDIAVNTGNVEEVRNLLGFDLTKIYEPEVGDRLTDFVLLVNIICVLCRPQARLRNLTDTDFGEAMVGDVLSDAVDALWAAISDFFPSRTRSLMNKIRAAGVLIETQADKDLEALDPQTIADMAIKALRLKMLSPTAISLVE